MSRKDDIQQLIINHYRRLEELRKAQATSKPNDASKLRLEIEATEGVIKQLEAELEAVDDSQTAAPEASTPAKAAPVAPSPPSQPSPSPTTSIATALRSRRWVVVSGGVVLLLCICPVVIFAASRLYFSGPAQEIVDQTAQALKQATSEAMIETRDAAWAEIDATDTAEAILAEEENIAASDAENSTPLPLGDPSNEAVASVDESPTPTDTPSPSPPPEPATPTPTPSPTPMPKPAASNTPSPTSPPEIPNNPPIDALLNRIPLVVHHGGTFTCASHNGLANLLDDVVEGHVIGPHAGDFVWKSRTCGKVGNVLFKVVGNSFQLIRQESAERFCDGEEFLDYETALQMIASGEIEWNGGIGDLGRGVPGCDLTR